jgi:hypothetical protein
VLAYSFTENHQFAAKTDRNFTFFGRDQHIPDRLYLMVSYMSFTAIQKIQIFAQNPYVLADDFIENRRFAAKTDRNSVFVGHDPHISDQLYLMVMCDPFRI